ncbi:hypothetical protein [Hoeflea olei]|uniref:Uncharacterized protein n=1 Tax=Hoeflea olei TaxID=1480615 RepID=A0A1C1YTD0_9HYPH|nr:hypothetical protein [Hoeflea olei]OCW56706.1 hypothetical protein AWJ14_17410 [Hoeflea olei]
MDLSKIVGIFEREFAIAYLVPTLIFAVELHLIGLAFGQALIPFASGAFNEIIAASSFIVTVVVFSVVLMTFSPLIMRALQGYVWQDYLESLALTRRFEDDYNFRFRAAVEFQAKVDEARRLGQEVPPFPDGHADRLDGAITSYPDKTEFFLPFRIGNYLRAAEVYPRVVYGLDAIGSWQRLQTLISEELRGSISAARSQLFFAANVLVLTMIALAITIWLMMTTSQFSFPVLLGLGVVLYAARSLVFISGGAYGQVFAAAYDLHRTDLADKLGLEIPRNAEAERRMWTEVNRVFLYRSPHAWDRLTRFRKKD